MSTSTHYPRAPVGSLLYIRRAEVACTATYRYAADTCCPAALAIAADARRRHRALIERDRQESARIRAWFDADTLD